jgi:Flp pilus assembly protein TadD
MERIARIEAAHFERLRMPMPKRVAATEDQLALRREVARFSHEGRHAEAAAVLEGLLLARPKNPLIWNDLGVALDAMGETERAIAAFRRGLVLSEPAYPPLRFHLARLQLEAFLRETDVASRKTEAARTALAEIAVQLNASLDGDPENVEAHNLLAVTYELLERDDLAALHAEVARRMSS